MPPGLTSAGPAGLTSPAAAPGRAFRLNPGLRSTRSDTTYTRGKGNHDVPGQVLHVIEIDSTNCHNSAVNGSARAGQVLKSWVATFPGKVGAVKFYATDIAVGTSNTVMDVRVNGVTCWLNDSDRPLLDARASGEFANARPDRGSFQQGALVQVLCTGISTIGHKLCGTVDILAP